VHIIKFNSISDKMVKWTRQWPSLL